MPSHLIDLPSSIRLHNVGSLLRAASFFPPKPEAFTLAFHPKHSQFEPFGLAMIAAWADYWNARKVPIRCRNATASGVAYANRLGLFDFITVGNDRNISEHEQAGRFVRLRKIKTKTELTSLVAEMGALLREHDLIEAVQYTVSEMCANVIEHAGAPAFICVQAYPKAKRVSIGIADCGRGVRESLRRNHNFATDEAAIVGAAKPGVSGESPTPYGSADNAGLGLFYARGIARITQQYFLLASGTAAYRQSRAAECCRPARNPLEELHKLYSALPVWRGTIVAVDVGQIVTSHKDVIATIGKVVGPDESIREAKGRIRFT